MKMCYIISKYKENHIMGNELFLAKPEDGKQISDILESAAGNGMVVMSYTRRPDAYLSYQKVGAFWLVSG